MKVYELDPDSVDVASYSCCLVFVGCEERALHAFEKFGFGAQEVIFVLSDETLVDPIRSLISSIPSTCVSKRHELEQEILAIVRRGRVPRIFVDFSSAPKDELASMICFFNRLGCQYSFEVDFSYSHGSFVIPAFEEKIGAHPEPVSAELSGFDPDSGRSLALVLGLGYEPNLVLSFIEYLDPNPRETWTFSPKGHDERFEVSVAENNANVFTFVPESRRLRYPFDDLYSTFERLESFVASASIDHRVAIAPYGMKTFLLSALLVSILHSPKVSVWHLKHEPQSYRVNRVADGKISLLRTAWFPGENALLEV